MIEHHKNNISKPNEHADTVNGQVELKDKQPETTVVDPGLKMTRTTAMLLWAAQKTTEVVQHVWLLSLATLVLLTGLFSFHHVLGGFKGGGLCGHLLIQFLFFLKVKNSNKQLIPLETDLVKTIMLHCS